MVVQQTAKPNERQKFSRSRKGIYSLVEVFVNFIIKAVANANNAKSRSIYFLFGSSLTFSVMNASTSDHSNLIQVAHNA